ncbi:uncharacterized protein PITG_18022 [Phytophthora infestans T30-4]|uniref:Uncharacterized protein n=1 Tax=Phytophthora infestans (strain T30-4) TaxID=403677 RepID=D0NXJ0_PHYIT|nr:uncharacterized protein PITG_18022 [Phytophthora infestans T30-4]EEY67790.1 conserved hypothetical protein [Phytophthora infestans T30-4]|eukprot:XP_002997952.1 conserved hypothetical protein [Phytophthora infestans T30-4]
MIPQHKKQPMTQLKKSMIEVAVKPSVSINAVSYMAESSQESELGSSTSRNKTAPSSDIDIATSTSANPGVNPGVKPGLTKYYATKAAVTVKSTEEPPSVKSDYPTVKAEATKKISKNVGTQGGRLEVLRIPKPKPRSNQRIKLKQARLEKPAKPNKLAVITLPDKHVPSVSRVIVWATNTSDQNHVSEILAGYPTILNDDFMNARVAHSCRESVSPKDYVYNFVIPKPLVIKLKAVIEAERKKRPKSKYFNPVVEHQDSNTEAIIAYFPGGTPRFTRSWQTKWWYSSRALV